MADRLEALSDALRDAAFARTLAEEAARAAYPAGAEVIVRTQRWGYQAREHRGVVEGASVNVNRGFSGSLAYVVLIVRNAATGKVSTRYPGIDVDGMPQVRLAEDKQHRGDSRGGEVGRD